MVSSSQHTTECIFPIFSVKTTNNKFLLFKSHTSYAKILAAEAAFAMLANLFCVYFRVNFRALALIYVSRNGGRVLPTVYSKRSTPSVFGFGANNLICRGSTGWKFDLSASQEFCEYTSRQNTNYRVEKFFSLYLVFFSAASEIRRRRMSLLHQELLLLGDRKWWNYERRCEWDGSRKNRRLFCSLCIFVLFSRSATSPPHSLHRIVLS